MSKQPVRRFKIKVEEGTGHGDLYELEKTTYYHIVDVRSQSIVMTFEGGMSASLSKTTGQWEDFQYEGVRKVVIVSNGQSALIKYYDGREETVPLPQ